MWPQRNRNAHDVEIQEDVSREDIVTAFRTAMVGHFRSHVPGTNINEATLLASDYLNHFHELVMLFEALASDPEGFAEDFRAWRPLTYEEHFASSGFRDKNLAIAAYRRAPADVRAHFDEAVAKLHAEALRLIACVGAQLDRGQALDGVCQDATAQLHMLIDKANAIATGELPAPPRPEAPEDERRQAAIDALFATNLAPFDP